MLNWLIMIIIILLLNIIKFVCKSIYFEDLFREAFEVLFDRYFILNLNYFIQINVQVIGKYKYSSWIDKIKQIEYKRWVIKQNSSCHFFDLSECSMTTQWHNKIFISMTRDQYNSKYSEVWKMILIVFLYIVTDRFEILIIS